MGARDVLGGQVLHVSATIRCATGTLGSFVHRLHERGHGARRRTHTFAPERWITAVSAFSAALHGLKNAIRPREGDIILAKPIR